jgi:hypothetical protein
LRYVDFLFLPLSLMTGHGCSAWKHQGILFAKPVVQRDPLFRRAAAQELVQLGPGADRSTTIPGEGETVGRSAELPVAGPETPVVPVPEPVWRMPTFEPVSPSLAAPPFVLAPIAIPTKAEAERAAKEEQERKQVRRWP